MTRTTAAGAVLGGVIVTAIVVTSLVIAVYPGIFELTAPVLCPDHQPDAFVVSYSSGTDGGSIFTLICMGGRGEFTEAGTWRPLGLVFGATASILVAVALLLALVVRLTRTRRPPGGDRPLPDDRRSRPHVQAAVADQSSDAWPPAS